LVEYRLAVPTFALDLDDEFCFEGVRRDCDNFGNHGVLAVFLKVGNGRFSEVLEFLVHALDVGEDALPIRFSAH